MFGVGRLIWEDFDLKPFEHHVGKVPVGEGGKAFIKSKL